MGLKTLDVAHRSVLSLSLRLGRLILEYRVLEVKWFHDCVGELCRPKRSATNLLIKLMTNWCVSVVKRGIATTT